MTRRPRLHVVVALAAALILLVLATSTRPGPPAPRHVARYVTAHGQVLRYVRAGAGPPLVLVHGYGESLVAWRSMFDELARDHDVIALDLPGFGLSSKPPTGYATDSLAAILLDAMSRLGVQRAVLAGHSMGGAVAVAAALRDSSRVRALLLIAPAVVGVPAALPDSSLPEASADAMRRVVATYEGLRTRFTPPHDAPWMLESDSALAYLPADDSAYAVSAAAALAEFNFDYLAGDRAKRLTQPTLVIWGEYDTMLPLQAGRDMAARIAGAEFRVIERSWHRPHQERPAETARLLADFLARLPPEGPPSH